MGFVVNGNRDGWKMIFFWRPAHFQVRAVSFRECTHGFNAMYGAPYLHLQLVGTHFVNVRTDNLDLPPRMEWWQIKVRLRFPSLKMQCHPGGDCYWLGSRSKSVSMTWCCCQQLTWPYLLLATISNHHRVKFCGSLYDPDKSIKSLSSWLTLATTSAVRGRDGPRIQLALNSSLIYNVSTREIFKKNKHNPVDGWKQSCLQGFIHPRWCRISMDFLHEQSLYIADLINILILEFDSKIQMEHFFSAKETIGAAWSHFKEPQRGHVVMFFVALWPLRPTLRPTPNSWSCSMAHLFHHKVVHEFSHHLQATPTWRYCLRMVFMELTAHPSTKSEAASQWWIKLGFDTRKILKLTCCMEKSERRLRLFWSLSKMKAWQHHQKRHLWGLNEVVTSFSFFAWTILLWKFIPTCIHLVLYILKLRRIEADNNLLRFFPSPFPIRQHPPTYFPAQNHKVFKKFPSHELWEPHLLKVGHWMISLRLKIWIMSFSQNEGMHRRL